MVRLGGASGEPGLQVHPVLLGEGEQERGILGGEPVLVHEQLFCAGGGEDDQEPRGRRGPEAVRDAGCHVQRGEPYAGPAAVGQVEDDLALEDHEDEVLDGETAPRRFRAGGQLPHHDCQPTAGALPVEQRTDADLVAIGRIG